MSVTAVTQGNMSISWRRRRRSAHLVLGLAVRLEQHVAHVAAVVHAVGRQLEAGERCGGGEEV